MTKMLKSLIVLTFIANLSYSQSLQGNVNCVGAIVEYTYVARAMESPEDTATESHMVTASWPSSAAAAAGQGFTRTLASYEVGDTITTALVPLVTPELLLFAGVAMDVDLNDDGTFTINEGSTYPTTEADIVQLTQLYLRFLKMDWTSTPGFAHPDDPSMYSMGWGISLSDVFAQFGAADLVNGQFGVDYGPGTPMENWGMVNIQYTDEAYTK